MFDLSGQSVLVIGGSSGIGRATAESARALGAAVTIASRDPERLAAVAAEIGVAGAPLDTTDDASAEAFFASAPIFDHVVVSAAATKSGPVRVLPLDVARAAMDSKFWGAYRVARSARIAPHGSLTFNHRLSEPAAERGGDHPERDQCGAGGAGPGPRP